MQVKQGLTINAVVSVITALIVLLILSLALYRINKANDAAKIAGDIILNSFERVTYRNDYLRNNNKRAKVQWFATHQEIHRILKAASKNFRTGEDKKAIDEMLTNHESIGKIFSAMVENREKKKSTAEDAVISQEVENRLLSQLNMKIYQVVLYGHELEESSRKARASIIWQAGVGIVFSFLVLLGAVVINSWTMTRAITDRIRILRDGAAVIGGGDLEHRIDIKGYDEFGELSQAFNAMTAKLRGSYHDLENEIEERKRAEKALRQTMEHERFLADVVERADVAFGVGAPDGRLLMFNRAFTDLTGYSREELNQRQLTWATDLTPVEWRESEAARLAEAIRVRQPVRYEKEYFRKDGTRVPIELFVQPVFDAGNNLLHYRSFLTDITERKRAEDALRESEERFRALTMASSDVVYRMNPDWSEMRQLHGRGFIADTEEPSRNWLQEYIHPDDQSHVKAVINEAIRTKSIFELEHRVLRVDGTLGWTFSRAIPLLDANGEIVEWFGAASDITGRKQAEEALRRSEERLRYHIENSPLAVVEWDADFIVTRWTGEAEKIFGWSAAETVGKPMMDLRMIFEEDIPIVQKTMEKLTDGISRHVVSTNRNYTKDGKVIHCTWYNTVLQDAAGKMKSVMSQVLDITERKRAEEEIRRRTMELEEANRELEGFSYSVSHDLRAPLRHMTGFADLLERRSKPQLDETSLHYVSVISQAAKKMGILIDDLLAFSRIGRSEIRMKGVSVTALVREVVQEMHTELTGRDVVWKIGELSDVYGDPSMLKLALANLISNAVKFTRTRSRAEIEIGCREEKEEVVFFVKDNGVGFDMKYADQLFGVFQRLHPGEEFEGTGIGLANVRRIISRHGGRTWAEGSPREGATVYFTLPKIKEA